MHAGRRQHWISLQNSSPMIPPGGTGTHSPKFESLKFFQNGVLRFVPDATEIRQLLEVVGALHA